MAVKVFWFWSQCMSQSTYYNLFLIQAFKVVLLKRASASRLVREIRSCRARAFQWCLLYSGTKTAATGVFNSWLEPKLNAMQVIKVTRQNESESFAVPYKSTWLEPVFRIRIRILIQIRTGNADLDPIAINSKENGLPCQRLAATPSNGNNNVLILHSST